MDVSRIRLLRDDVSVWLVYAGRGRRYFEYFEKEGVVFLSLPGFEASATVFQSEQLIRQHLAMSDNVRKWVNGGLSAPPSRRPESYSAYPHASGSTEAKSFSADVGNINRLFVQAKVGDLILTPPHGHYEPYLIGEITSSWSKNDDRAIEIFENEIVPVRKVTWLNTALARRDFPPKVSRRLTNQHAITQINPDLYADIFNKVYPAYVWGNQSKLDIFGDDYRGTDPLQTYPSAVLIKYVIASAFAFNIGKFSEFQSLQPAAAISAFYDEGLVQDFGQNFNSPGKFTIIGALGSLAILTAAGLHIATADPGKPFPQAQAEGTTAVKMSLQGPGKLGREQELDHYVSSMQAVNWKEVQKKLGKPSNDALNLSLSNKVEVARHRAELDER